MPARKSNPPHDDPEQSKRFVDMAREVEADEDPDAFERAFKRVIRPLPPVKVHRPKERGV
jgi:hypothetical protein